MSSKRQSNRSFYISMIMITVLLIGAGYVYGQTQTEGVQHAILQGNIQVVPEKPIPNDQTGKIQPGTPVKLKVIVENKGTVDSPQAKIYVRYALARPLDNETKSVIFETEKELLPAITPGGKIEISFSTHHQWPSLLDYVRNDWLMREYQAMVIFDNQEKLIGTLAITFSAYYYPGIHKEFPVPIE